MKISFRKLWVRMKTAILTDPAQSGKLDLGPGISVGFIFNPPSKFLGANFVSYLTFPEWKQFSLVLVWHSPGDFLGFGFFFPRQALKMPRKHGPSHAGPHQPSNRFLARQFPSFQGWVCWPCEEYWSQASVILQKGNVASLSYRERFRSRTACRGVLGNTIGYSLLYKKGHSFVDEKHSWSP